METLTIISFSRYHSWMQSEELLKLTGSERLQLEEEYANQISWRVDENSK